MNVQQAQKINAKLGELYDQVLIARSRLEQQVTDGQITGLAVEAWDRMFTKEIPELQAYFSSVSQDMPNTDEELKQNMSWFSSLGMMLDNAPTQWIDNNDKIDELVDDLLSLTVDIEREIYNKGLKVVKVGDGYVLRPSGENSKPNDTC